MATREVRPVRIGGRPVGPGREVYVIAEAGVNHNGDVTRADEMIVRARQAGADAVKFQAFRADAFVSTEAALAGYQRSGTPRTSQRDMLKDLELSADDLRRLARRCREEEIEFLAAPFDLASLELLVELGVAAVKIASPELTDVPLLEAAARTGLPLIVSTGAARLDEIAEAVDGMRDAGATDLILLHCVSAYPTPFEMQNLKAVATLIERFEVVAGYSDHSVELLSGRLAVGAGASLLEKHFTLDRGDRGPDHAMSLEPGELAEYIRLARKMSPDLAAVIEGHERSRAAMGTGEKVSQESEDDVRRVARKSLAARVDIPAGSCITRDMLTTMRPGTGIPATRIDEVVGARAVARIPAGSILRPEMLAMVNHQET